MYLNSKISPKKKMMVMFLILMGLCVTSVFAAKATAGITQLDTFGDTVLNLLSSTWLKAICAIAFAIEAGACILMGRQGESGIIKKFLPWMIGTIGILCASSITAFFFNNKGTTDAFTYLLQKGSTYLG